MAASVSIASPVLGLRNSSLAPCTTPNIRSALLTAPAAKNSMRRRGSTTLRVTCFNRDWLRKDFSVIGFGLIGWIAPSSIPAINGNSLTGLFFQSIGTELAHFPTGPSLNSAFWLWLVTWHFGLFVCLTFGQIGFKGRNEYF